MSKKFGLDDAFPEEENENKEKKLKAKDSGRGTESLTKEQPSSQELKEEASGKTKKSTSETKEKVSEDYDEGFLAREREKHKPEPITFHMNPIDAEIIRAAVDKTKEKTQRELISYFVDKFVEEKGIEKIIKVLNEYRNKDEDGLF